LQALTGAGVLTVGSQAAVADAQGERLRSLKRYAPKVYALKEAVEAGDFKTVLKKQELFTGLNGYWRNQEYNLKIQNDMKNNIINAAADGDKEGMLKYYMEYYNHPDLVDDREYDKVPRPNFIRGKGDIADLGNCGGNRVGTYC